MLKLKKCFTFVLVLVLCLSVIPFSALTVSAESVKIGYISGDDVNLRQDATTTAEKVATLSKWTVSVLGSKNDTLGTINPKTEKVYKWYQVSYVSLSKTIKGYIREDLITVTEYTLDSKFAETLKDFPKSYHASLTLLHAIYPNWEFVANDVGYSFSEAVTAQEVDFRKLAAYNYNSLRSMESGYYNWSKKKFVSTDTGKYAASREVIAYYMDPRNFLNANDIYVFMQQSFDSKTQEKSGVNKIVDGTYLDAKITNKKDKYYNKTYATVIMKAAKESKVNPYVLASTLIQEQGSKGSTLSKGTKYKGTTVYNFFNYGASGSNKSEVLSNGKKYAYKQGWTTPSKAIIEGAEKYSKGYISIGQDTYYYKNFNVLNPKEIWHQYAQSVHDSLSSSRFLKTCYAGYNKLGATFRIPVFDDMPKKASAHPKESKQLNNYYFNSIKVDGLSPAFNKYTTSYKLDVQNDIDVYISLPSEAVYTGKATYSLKSGANKIKLSVKSQTGYSRTYTITITAAKDCTLTIKQLGGTLVKEDDGKYYYFIDGKKSNETTLVKHDGKYKYVKNGVFTKATTFVKYLNKYYYVKDGIWEKETKFVKYKNKYYYLKDGIRLSESKFLKHKGKYYFFDEGKRSDKTGFVKYKGKYYYLKGGVRSTKTGFVKYKDYYYRLEKGVRTNKNPHIKYGKVYMRLSTTKFTYTAKARKPSVKIYTSNGKRLSTKYYSIKYGNGRKYVGKHKVTVTLEGKYSGKKNLYFTIVPKKTTLSQITAGKKSLKISVKKQPVQTKGYQIQYSTSKDFENAEIKSLTNKNKTSTTLKKLQSKKKYYIRVRTYKNVKGTRYYSDWSSYKTKKTS